jgi:hypothetical protein
MGKKEQARADAQFARGEVGVDGQATEEVKDKAVVEQDKAREQFLRGKAYLGREFLTWLLWRSEAGEPLLEKDGAPVTVVFTARLVLRGISGDIVESTARGQMAPYSPLLRQQLDRGLLVHGARIRLTHGEKTYETALDAEFLDFKSGLLPDLLTREDDDRLQERLYLVEQLSGLVQALLEEFLQLRASRKWQKDVVPAMKEWMRDVPAPRAAPRRAAAEA